MQESVLKFNEGQTFSVLGCQGVSCFPISLTTFLGNDGVPFQLAFLWCLAFKRDKFLVYLFLFITFRAFKK